MAGKDLSTGGEINDSGQNNDTSVATRDDNTQATNAQQATNQQQQPTAMETFMALAKSLILRAMIIYFIMSFFRRPGTPETNNPNAPTKLPSMNIINNGTNLDLYFYLSEKKVFNDFNNPDALLWKLDNIIYGDWYGGPEKDGSYSFSTSLKPSSTLKNNGSLYLHAYAVRNGRSPDPKHPTYVEDKTLYAFKQLNKFKRRKYLKTHNLLTGETALSLEQQRIATNTKGEVISHWHPNLTVNLVTDFTNWSPGSVPPPLNEYIEFVGGGAQYKPPLYMNDFWNMIRDYQPINNTVEELELRLTYQPLSIFRWQMYLSQSIKNKWYTMDVFGDAEEDEEDKDSLKEALLETSPYLLGATVVVSVLHSIFELLAFKNDIQFWNNRKSLEGLSVRSVFFNVFQSLIVLLYVLDNDTNTIVRISCFVGLAIELWKINKVVDIQINWNEKILGLVPRFTFKDKGSYVESSTREYDVIAFRYLSWAIYPLLIGYGIYSLIYQEHKGWYSWVLSMLYGFLLTFGFIMMTPQLFINYKLKSVAHLPWRMMTYKALNTFIDDIFAFVIKMPTMYRIGCFRDDIVFFIFLYQKFIYKTDLSRVNEFGFSGEDSKAEEKPAPLQNGVETKKIK